MKYKPNNIEHTEKKERREQIIILYYCFYICSFATWWLVVNVCLFDAAVASHTKIRIVFSAFCSSFLFLSLPISAFPFSVISTRKSRCYPTRSSHRMFIFPFFLSVRLDMVYKMIFQNRRKRQINQIYCQSE